MSAGRIDEYLKIEHLCKTFGSGESSSEVLRDISPIDPRVHRIVDLKAPGSGESHRNRWENLPHLTKRDEIKIVLADRADYEWAREVIRREKLDQRVGHGIAVAIPFMNPE